MLKLRRSVGESIILETSDGIVEIVVGDVRGLSGGPIKKVNLEFHAPDCIDIWRKEIYLERLNARNQPTEAIRTDGDLEESECPGPNPADQD